MPEYYANTCKNCGEDCDGKFCSWECEQEWQDGYEDYLYEAARDARLDALHEEGDVYHEPK